MKKPSQRRWHRIAITVLMWVSAAASFGWPAVWAVTYATLASVVVGVVIAIAAEAICGPSVDGSPSSMTKGAIGFALPSIVGGFTYAFAPDAFALQLGLGVFAAQWLKDLIDKAVYGRFIWDEPA